MPLITYLLIRAFGLPFALMPYPLLHFLGRIGGRIAFTLHRSFRKKAMTNLAIAYPDKPESWRRKIAIASFQNLMITALELFRLKRSRGRMHEIVTLEDRPEIEAEMSQGVIFLTGHQANWEIPFLAVTDRYPGIAIGRPIKNPYLYRWVLSVREMNGGTIVMPRQAIRSGLRALKEGKFLGIVGDQAFPESPYSYPLFGTRAWTMSTPAVMAYRTGRPIVVGMTRRSGHRYTVRASDMLWPDLSKPRDEEVPRLMDAAMQTLEQSIAACPEQWMWQHDRWKQQGIDHTLRKYRYGFILVVLPPDPTELLKHLPALRTIYPRAYLTFFVPAGTQIPLDDVSVIPYDKKEDLFVRDWRYQLVIDLYGLPKLRRHFRRLGAFQTLSVQNLQHLSGETALDQMLLKSLVKPECLKTVSTSTLPSSLESATASA